MFSFGYTFSFTKEKGILFVIIALYAKRVEVNFLKGRNLSEPIG